MTRVTSQTRSTKQLKANTKKPDTEQHPKIKTIKKPKDGWEMSAREALLVNFVVSEV